MSKDIREERWVGSARRECLDRILIFSRLQLERVLAVYVEHFNEHRPHRALGQRPPTKTVPAPAESVTANIVDFDCVIVSIVATCSAG